MKHSNLFHKNFNLVLTACLDDSQIADIQTDWKVAMPEHIKRLISEYSLFIKTKLFTSYHQENNSGEFSFYYIYQAEHQNQAYYIEVNGAHNENFIEDDFVQLIDISTKHEFYLKREQAVNTVAFNDEAFCALLSTGKHQIDSP